MRPTSIKFLHTNDFHGALDEPRVEVLRAARADADLYFDSGDCIKTGNLGVPLKPDPVWPLLAEMNCTASVPGNRESHILRSAFEAKIAGHRHPVVCANLFDKENHRVLPASIHLDWNGISIGILGVMVPMVTDRMASKAVSQFLWETPISCAVDEARALRKSCDLVIALTHIGVRQDQLLAESTSDIDIIFGGHSHTMLETPLRVGNTFICQGGSHGRFYGLYEWAMGLGLTSARLHELGA